MIAYRDNEEKIVALHFAERLHDKKAMAIIVSGEVKNKEEAVYFSDFFWKMNAKAIQDDNAKIKIPCDGSSEYWIEKIYNSWEGYMLKVGYAEQWDKASDDA